MYGLAPAVTGHLGPDDTKLYGTGANNRLAGPIEAATKRSAPNRKRRICSTFVSGETRNRTEDTTIFSRVLYQLSYLALVGAMLAARGCRTGAWPPVRARE